MNSLEHRHIKCGVDEAGRGCLWGPLYVAIVAGVNDWHHPEVDDSKRLSWKTRAKLVKLITSNTMWVVSPVSAKAINQHGVDECTRIALSRALAYMSAKLNAPMWVMCDGHVFERTPLFECNHEIKIHCEPKADANHFEVGAASILAKHKRDQAVLTDQRDELNLYDIRSNFGYHTQKHIEALDKHGMLEDHRTKYVKTALRNYRRQNPTQLELFDGEH